MKTMLRKSVTLLTALLVTTGGFLAFESFTAERGKTAGTRTILVKQYGFYVANLCIKNRSKFDHEVCTGKVTEGSNKDLTIPWDPGDEVVFIAAIVGGHNAFYGPIADRDSVCWSDGSLFRYGAYCRQPSEAPG